MIAAIDPGLRGCGVSVFLTDGRQTPKLLQASYVRNPNRKDRGAPAWQAMADAVRLYLRPLTPAVLTCLVVESQQTYARGAAARASAQSGDLLEVTGVAASCLAFIRAERFLQPLPFDWKRNKEKKAKCAEIERETIARGWSKEVILPTAKKLQLDVWDSVGLGLWALVRLRVTAGADTSEGGGLLLSDRSQDRRKGA